MPWHQLVTASVSLAGVLALIVLLSRFGRGLSVRRVPAGKNAAITIKESRPLDAKRRLHLVEINGFEVLVLTGGGTDTMLPVACAAGPCP